MYSALKSKFQSVKAAHYFRENFIQQQNLDKTLLSNKNEKELTSQSDIRIK